MKKLTDDEFIKLMIDKECEIVNAPFMYDDLITKRYNNWQTWFNDYAFTSAEQYAEWKQFFIDNISKWKQGKITKHYKETMFNDFSLEFGFSEKF